jgi:hypothetical protein
VYLQSSPDVVIWIEDTRETSEELSTAFQGYSEEYVPEYMWLDALADESDMAGLSGR